MTTTERLILQATVKLKGSVKLARECSHNWLETRDYRYLELRESCMRDARGWKEALTRAQEDVHQ